MTLADEIAVNEALLAFRRADRGHENPSASMSPPSRVAGWRQRRAGQGGSLVVSDIPGDNPALVAVRPTVPDSGSRQDALASISAYGMKLPAAVMAHLNSPAADASKSRR